MEAINDLIVGCGVSPIIAFSPRNKVLDNSKISVYLDGKSVKEALFSSNSVIELPEPENDFTKYDIEIISDFKKREISFTVLKLKKDEPYVICDIDFTLSATNIFLYLTENLLKIKKIYHSKEALQEIAKNNKIVYLTGRIIKYAGLTKKWLHLNGYPEGPLISRGYEVPYNLEEFKKNSIKEIVKLSDKGVGIGDLKSDILAYKANNIVAVRIVHPILSYSKKDNYQYRDNHYVVNSWKGIEKLFNEKKLLHIK